MSDRDYLYDRVVEINDKLEELPTLRDQFAMAALTGIIANNTVCQQVAKDDAEAAYTVADAMLKVREVKEVNDGD